VPIRQSLVLTPGFTDWTGDVSAYTGGEVVFRFSFDTVDDIANTHEGWYVDDVVVTRPRRRSPSAGPRWSIHQRRVERDLVVLEAATQVFLRADDGSGTPATAIRSTCLLRRPSHPATTPMPERWRLPGPAPPSGSSADLSLALGISTNWFDIRGAGPARS